MKRVAELPPHTLRELHDESGLRPPEPHMVAAGEAQLLSAF